MDGPGAAAQKAVRIERAESKEKKRKEKSSKEQRRYRSNCELGSDERSKRNSVSERRVGRW